MSEEQKKIICVSCPLGCTLTVTCEKGVVHEVEGNTCPRGRSYAEAEVRDPRRVFASTVRVRGGRLPVCPVRSREPAPRDRLFDIARAVAALDIDAPIAIGQVVLPNACGTGVDIVASRDLAAEPDP